MSPEVRGCELCVVNRVRDLGDENGGGIDCRGEARADKEAAT